MTRTGADRSFDRPAPTTPWVDPLLDAKLHRPPTRADWVERGRLLELLDHAVERPMVLVAAPAGFGKTTLVTQWLAGNRGPRATAWVSLDPHDNDPVLLWTHVAQALERVGCRPKDDVATFTAAHDGEVLAGVLPRLLEAMAGMPEELVIVLDDFHVLRDAACHAAGGVPRRAPAPAGPPDDPHPRRSRPAGQLAPGDWSAGRDPRRGPGLHGRGDLLAAGRRARSPVRRLRARPGAAHGRVAGGALPGHVVHVRTVRPGRVRPRGQRRQPLHRRLPDRGGPGRSQ